ncbi:FecR domain-containing protein [Pseudomonas sp. PA27(2017)]|uniref:FecR domain-containing protein n=1 Tax=Pseudomonas sp. PA27(2017) TaxID=1932112 RepID=UPI000964C402|nr:FecR domain-containing protein [Pseudomonas sp. PA27(2017)]OLU35464.1 iron dicitrate transport regulator FecR [Pseudomonas sp. PA27(2017)]
MKQVLAEAVEWYVRLHDSAATEQTRAEWQAWLGADPLHAKAWERVETLRQRLSMAPPAFAGTTIENARQQRRAAIKTLAVLLGVGAVGWGGYRVSPLGADYSTSVGQRMRFTLSDGSSLVLDTGTRVDVRFDSHRRLIILRQGAILVETAKDARTLSVQTREGEIEALGTRFTVRQDDNLTRVAVEAHAVEVRPRLAPGDVLRAEAGQTVSFTAVGIGPLKPAGEQGSAWARGMLVVVDWRLDDLLAELSRYRHGFLGCSPDIAGLRLSGTFLLDDTEGALANLEDSLPVRVRRLTRYWVRVEARAV